MSNSKDFIIENGVLKKYVGPGGDVVIPDEVEKIGKSAFFGNKDIKSVSIGGNVKEICDEAFVWCRSLAEVILGEGVRSIGRRSFQKCESILKILIPATVEKIGKSAFEGTNISSITMLGSPVLETLAFSNSGSGYIVDPLVYVVPVTIYAPEDLAVYPALIDWKVLSPEDTCLFIRRAMTGEFEIRQADFRWLIQRLMSSPKVLIPEFFKNITPEELVVIKASNTITAENADLLLELTQDNIPVKMELVQYISEHITDGHREMVEDAKADAALQKRLKRDQKVAALLKKYEKLKPEDVKALWSTGKTDSGLCIKSYRGTDAGFVVPAEIMKKPVFEIAATAFSAEPAPSSGRRSASAKIMYKVRHIVLCEGIKKISAQVFAGCTYLESVKLPASIEEIAPDAFEGCKALTIYAPTDSCAASYAMEHEIPFVVE